MNVVAPPRLLEGRLVGSVPVGETDVVSLLEDVMVNVWPLDVIVVTPTLPGIEINELEKLVIELHVSKSVNVT